LEDGQVFIHADGVNNIEVAGGEGEGVDRYGCCQRFALRQ
jgi:hypothetical protein